MKKYALLFSFLFCLSAYSQQDSVQKPFFYAKKFHSAFFVQFEGQGAYVFNKVSMISGIGVNWVINYKYYIGVRYNLLSTPVNVVKLLPLIDKSGKVGASHQSASLNFGYIAFAKKRFSVNPELSVGWADCKFIQPADGLGNPSVEKHFNYGIVIPSVNAIWNAHKNIRLGAGVGARAVFGQDYYRLKTYRVSGVFGGVFIRVGTF